MFGTVYISHPQQRGNKGAKNSSVYRGKRKKTREKRIQRKNESEF